MRMQQKRVPKVSVKANSECSVVSITTDQTNRTGNEGNENKKKTKLDSSNTVQCLPYP